MSSASDTQKAAAIEKTRLELGKLLSVALQRLRERERPPTVFEAASTMYVGGNVLRHGLNLHATASAVRGAVRLVGNSGNEWQRGHDSRASDVGTHYEDEEDEGNTTSGQGAGPALYSTEQTFRHLTVVRDTLIIEGSTIFSPSPAPALTRQKGSWVGRSMSPSRKRETEDSQIKPSTTNESLLDELISTLAEIIKEDCRYKVTRFRPYCPPNALQGVVLEVASILARLQRNSPTNLTRIGVAMLPAFSTFSPSLHERILKFYEELLKGMLSTFSKDRLAGFENVGARNIRGLGRQNTNESVPEIQVEWATEEDTDNATANSSFEPWVKSRSQTIGVSAWTAPRQPRDNYFSGSLLSPLLACMFRVIAIHSHDHVTLYRFYETLSTIIRLKEDAYSDIIDVVAFESSKSRRTAIETLATFWPRAFGHLVLSGPLQIASYQEFLRRIESNMVTQSPHLRHNINTQAPQQVPYFVKEPHEFIIWRFQAAPAPLPGNQPKNRPINRFSANCAVCTKSIIGLGLICPCCTLTVHVGSCYDHEAGVDRLKYTSKDGQHERISVIRYSRRLPQRLVDASEAPRKDRHHFQPIHLFSLTLCFICRKPSWGCYDQGLRCSSCLYFAHSACVEKSLGSKDIPSCRSTPFSHKSVTIQWEDLRRSWNEFYTPLIWKEEDLFHKSYDEVSVAYGIFWMELELLQAGTTAGSIVVEQSSPRNQPSTRANGPAYDKFELHYFIALYLAQLSGSRLPKSRNTLEYIENCGNVDAEVSLVHHLPILLLAASVIKLPQIAPPSNNGEMLQVTSEGTEAEGLPHPYEIVSLAHIRDALGHEVSLHSDASARFVMSQLYRLGIFIRIDSSLTPFQSSDLAPTDIMCTFPSTLAIDASTSVEALFASIQASLEDLDVSVNEFGFLLLVRRCWPSSLMTDYALSRLASIVLAWILSEDDRLLQIVRDYVAVGEPLPGVKSRSQPKTWPSILTASENVGGVSGSGATDYTATRRVIIERYANPWLHQLHDLNRALYAECLYQQCLQSSEASLSAIPGNLLHPERKGVDEHRRNVEMVDDTLKYVVKLCQWGVVWTTFDDLFVNWLDTMSKLGNFATPAVFKNLPRLFSSEDYSVNRLSVADEATNVDVSQYLADPWRVIVDAASEDTAGLERCLQWVLVLARSGVEIPNATLMQLSAFARDFSAPFITHAILAEVLLYSVWVKAFGRGELLTLISSLYARQSAWLKNGMANSNQTTLIHGFLRHTLAACLLLYGCKRETVRSLNLLDQSQLITLPPRRKSNVTTGGSTDPLSIDMDMLDLLSTAAIEGTVETCVIIAKFLSTLVSKESGDLLTDAEVDQFVMINGYTLCKCAWHFYSKTQIPELDSLRIKFLLRLLVVDTQPFENLLTEVLSENTAWEIRFEAISRIFRIILDVNSPGLDLGGRQWRPDVVFIFVRFFSQCWIDERAEVRLACEILIATLLPMHLDTITLCFEEYLMQAKIPERASLAVFLTLLHPVLPSWRLVSWSTLVQVLGVNDDQRRADDLVIENELEITTLRATLVNLALQMIADGIMADLSSLLQIKLCLVQLIGFQRCQVKSGRGTFRVDFDGLSQLSLSPVVQSCFQGLMRALDTSLPCDLPPACMVQSIDDSVAQGLLGSVFVDVVIKSINQMDFLQIPYTVSRCLLTSLVIVLSKHDFTSPLLNDWVQPLFKAVHTAMELLSQPSLSIDLKQMVFTAAGQAVKQIHMDRKTSTIILSEYVATTTAVVAEYGVTSDHMLAARARQFFDEILTQFEGQKLYFTLFRYPCSQDFFAVLAQIMRERSRNSSQAPVNSHGDSMRDAVVREVLASIQDKRQPGDVDMPLKNLCKYVEVVHHTSYSESIIAYLGFTLTSMAAQITDWKPGSFDSNSLLHICSMVAQHHKPHSKDLLFQGEKYLRVVLSRFSVSKEAISQLLQVSTSSHRRLSRLAGSSHTPNYIPSTLFDVTSGILRGRLRAQSSTLEHLLEVICQSCIVKDGVFDLDQVVTITIDGVSYFQDRIPDGSYTDGEFTAYESLAKLMIQATNMDPKLLASVVPNESENSLRMWNFLLLAVLSTDWSECAFSLWRMRTRFSQLLQRALVPQQVVLSDSASTELNQAFIALRLWLLLIQQICSKSALSTVFHVADRDQCERSLWNEFWPSFERVLTFSIGAAGFDDYQTHFALIWQSFSDILLFLHQSRSLIPLESSLVAHLAQVKDMPLNESLSNKITKTIRTLSQPPVEVPPSSSLLVLRGDFLAVEKIGWEFRRHAEDRGKDDSVVRRQFRQPTTG